MKRLLLIILIVLFSLVIISGCRGDEKPPLEEENKQEVEERVKSENESPEKLSNGGAEYPPEIRVWRENMRDYFVAAKVSTEDGTFLIINWGQKATAGYSLSIVEMIEKEEELRVEVKFEKPEGMVAQVLTYPYLVQEIEDTEKRLNFVPVKGENYIPQVVGLEVMKPFRATSENIKIIDWELEKNKLTVLGLARVFEANLNYELLDQEGELLVEDFETAATAGPNWGAFEIKVEDLEEVPAAMTIFSISAKDASRENEVRLEFNN